ncbi:MAG: DUF2299 family protein [Candidatus Saliniplasma sp.]
MKEQILEWLDEDDREYKVGEHPKLDWMIQVKHGNRTVLLGKPLRYIDRLEIVYKLNVSEEHKKVIQQLENKQRNNFEKSLVMLLSVDAVIYNIHRDDNKLPDSIVIKKHMYMDDIKKTRLFDTIQKVINMGMRTTIHFQSLGGAVPQEEEMSSAKTGPSLYR